MSFIDRAAAGYRAFMSEPVRGAEKLRSMPTQAVGPRPKGKKRIERIPFDYRRWMPPDVENALAMANGSGELRQVAAIADWVKSHPIVFGVMSGATSTPTLPYGVNYSDEASAWLQGVKGPNGKRGWRDRIADPSELKAIALDDYNAGQGVGMFIWNARKGRPELQALDNAGLRYLPGEDRYQYHGWSKVYDVEPGNGVWVMKTRVKSSPWREGNWHRIAYAIMDAVQAAIQRGVWIHGFSLPTVLAKYPLGSSEDQKARFTNSVIGAALRAIGVTPGYDLDFKQASAEGGSIFKDVEDRLERAVSILVWGTVGLIAGGSGFANSDLFAEQKAAVVGEEARKQAAFENEQIWAPVLDWAAKAGHISKAATGACIEYNPETPAVVLAKAVAAKALMDAGYSPDEAQKRVGLEKQAYGDEAPDSGVRPTMQAPQEELPEPSYSEQLARDLNTRNDRACPHERARYCPSCGVRERHELRDGKWSPVWHPIRRVA